MTKNIRQRMKQHNSGTKAGAKYTRTRTPVELAWKAAFVSQAAAMSAERAIKKLKRAQKVALIEGDLSMLDQVSSPPLRAPSDVMKLARMGQSFPHRLSFSRQIIRRLLAEDASVTRPVWDIDQDGYGTAVYSVHVGGHTYSLVAISCALDDSMRSDRVIAEAWDACFTLFDGVPSRADLDRLRDNQPRQEAGRYSAKELTLSRANKSVRMFNAVRDALAKGEQPDAEMINKIGYLMRTTAVYGNGKFGIADRHDYSDRPGMSAPFQAEMLTVWLIRGFTHDLVEHCAQALNPDAVELAPALKRHLGVGNSTGLGMAPFLVHHPELLNQWVWARETALAMALQADDLVPQDLIDRAMLHMTQWDVADVDGQANIELTRRELATLNSRAATDAMSWAKDKSLMTQELVVALVLESTFADIEPLADQLFVEGQVDIDPKMSLTDFSRTYDAAAKWHRECEGDDTWFWYVSENKLEPRVGERATLDGAELERPLTIARQLHDLDRAIWDQIHAGKTKVADLLNDRPDLASIIRRVQVADNRPYSEIQDNLCGQDMRPIDMLRFKLAFFGAAKFDPKSKLWTRITLFQGAPTRESLAEPGDNWWMATL